MRILILNCYSRNSLAIINSLDPSYELIGGAVCKAHSFIRYENILKSTRIKEIFRYADPEKEPEKFRDDIIHSCEVYRPDAVIASGTTVTNYLSYYKKEISQHTEARLLVENYPTLVIMADKWLLYNLCLEVGIPVPKTVLLVPECIANLSNLLRFPVIIKPRNLSASQGIKFFETPSELTEYCKATGFFGLDYDRDAPPMIVQESIQGELHDVTSCSRDGQIVSILSQQRLVSLYDFGGGGIVNKTTYEPVAMGYAEVIIRRMKWSGVAEFDFILDKEGNYYLLECNPKVWGTTQLTIEAGLNVIQQLVDIFVLGKHIERKDKYEVDLLYRWIFPECAYHWIQKPRAPLRICRRIVNSFRNYNAKRTISNIKKRDLLHQVGIVLDKGYR